jgi:hypothetical protein
MGVGLAYLGRKVAHLKGLEGKVSAGAALVMVAIVLELVWLWGYFYFSGLEG